MKFTLSDNLHIILSEKGKSILNHKNHEVTITSDNKAWFKIWELKMLFGNKTINLRNSNPIVQNEFFKYSSDLKFLG